LVAPNTPLTNVVAFAAAGASNIAVNTACAVTSDGKLWCWGDLSWIVQKGTPLASPYAQAITTDGLTALTGVIQATFATTGACAVIRGTPNSVWCWGDNAAGELAQGDTMNRQYPIKVPGLTAPTKVVMTDSHYDHNTICVLDGDSVRCWGNNDFGTVGVNSTVNPIPSPSPVVIQNGTTILGGVSDIEPGFAAVAALRTDGSLWTWGYGFATYASNFGLTNILTIAYAGGYGGNGPRFLTSDGIYHSGMTVLPVTCGAL
jgi:alpha-tubulin suppressor-like RCC1 family protein